MDLGVEGKRVAIETIATLVNIKNVMGDLLLRPAGIPPELYHPLLYQRDASTGRSPQTRSRSSEKRRFARARASSRSAKKSVA